MAGDVVPLKKVGGLRSPPGGRPRWRPKPKKDETLGQAWDRSRFEVRHYAAIGYPHAVICRLVDPPMDDGTLRAHFMNELENGRWIANAKVAGVGYSMAVSGRFPDMTRFWLRTRMGWRDTGDVKTPTEPIQFQKIEGDDW